jgi:hypothetical protein
MTDLVAQRYQLAVNAITAAFTLVARHTMSSSTLEIIELNRRLGDLHNGDEGRLRRTLQSLNNLPGSPELFTFRLVTASLVQSLPRICRPQMTARDLVASTADLNRLATEAMMLRASDIAFTLGGIIDAIRAHASTGGTSDPRGQLH